MTRHQFRLELVRCGLSYREAGLPGMEEALCLLHHTRLEHELQALDMEQARVASLPFAEAHEQQQLLSALRHRGQGLLDRFYRAVPGGVM